MWTPRINREEDIPTLREFIRGNSLCALVTATNKGLVASHIPVVLHEEGDGFGFLRCHVARANSQWRDHRPDEEALAIFTGPQHYISASWYPGKKIHGEEVPTWNYVAVHIYGRMRTIDDPQWLLEHLRALADNNEGIAEIPWKLSDAPAEYLANMVRGIVGIEIEVTRVEGKWKVSQNRTDEDARAVMDGLDQLRTPAGETMRRLIEKRRPHSD